jgi:hypothetical protein
MESISGLGGFCVANQYYHGGSRPAAAPRARRKGA